MVSLHSDRTIAKRNFKGYLQTFRKHSQWKNAIKINCNESAGGYLKLYKLLKSHRQTPVKRKFPVWCRMMYECPMAAVRKHHSSASNNVTYSSIFLEAESLKSRCW